MVEKGYADAVRAFFDISSTLYEFLSINKTSEENFAKVMRVEALNSSVHRKQHLLSILIILKTYDEKIKKKVIFFE